MATWRLANMIRHPTLQPSPQGLGCSQRDASPSAALMLERHHYVNNLLGDSESEHGCGSLEWCHQPPTAQRKLSQLCDEGFEAMQSPENRFYASPSYQIDECDEEYNNTTVAITGDPSGAEACFCMIFLSLVFRRNRCRSRAASARNG